MKVQNQFRGKNPEKIKKAQLKKKKPFLRSHKTLQPSTKLQDVVVYVVHCNNIKICVFVNHYTTVVDLEPQTVNDYVHEPHKNDKIIWSLTWIILQLMSETD